MKTKTIFLTFFVALLSVSSAWADVPCPTCDPGGGPKIPIDENLSVLLVAALIFGIVVIYKNKIKKASV